MSDKIEVKKGNNYFGVFEPIDVLIWLDGPRTFTLLDQDGQMCIAHWFEEKENQWHYVVVPITDQILKELNNGEQSLLDVLQQPRVYLVAVDTQFQVQSVALTYFDQLPKDALPERGAMIRRELEPFFRLRSMGDAIRPGDIPGSVIKTTVENAQKAIRLLAEYELNHPSRKGKRSKALRELYDLPAQRIQAASFEVSFRSPFSDPSLFDQIPPTEQEEDKSVLDRICGHLQTGIAWLESNEDEQFFEDKAIDAELKNRIVEAMKFLTPPTSGAIQRTEVSGRAFKLDRVVALNRNDRRRVFSLQRKFSGVDAPKRFEGYGTIIDILGDDAEISVEFISGGRFERACKFNEELWEAYGEKFHYHQMVQVFGVISNSKDPITVLEIGFPDDNSEIPKITE